ncbi:MAG TPA: FHA domain-containing protein [Solirubrobacter sp.]|nr:FHA domain-containing protein [Solirubrobacter sp.]
MTRTPHQATPAELKARIEAERIGSAFLVLRDDEGEQRIVGLDPRPTPLTVGRGSSSDVRLGWDREVSRVHAELACVGRTWTLSDDGLSRNGSFVNGDRVTGKRRLEDGDLLQVGTTEIVFRNPLEYDGTLPTQTSAPLPEGPALPPLTPAQERVAKALCRPFATTEGLATPATNQEIAEELFLSVAAVKTHLRSLFRRFEIEHLPQNGKRLRLVELLIRNGDVDERELRAA